MRIILVPVPVSVLLLVSAGLAAAQPARGPAAGDMLGRFQSVQQHDRTYSGPPLVLQQALTEALSKNPELLALRAQFEAAKQRPAQERSLPAQVFETQVWQWPFNVLNPTGDSMYMVMATQDLPGRGKRAVRVAAAAKEAELAEAEITIRAGEILDDVKRVYAELHLARKEIDIHLVHVDLLRQLAEISEAKYATGGISQQDVLKAVGELSRLHGDLIRLDRQARLAEISLNTLLDRPAGSPIKGSERLKGFKGSKVQEFSKVQKVLRFKGSRVR